MNKNNKIEDQLELAKRQLSNFIQIFKEAYLENTDTIEEYTIEMFLSDKKDNIDLQNITSILNGSNLEIKEQMSHYISNSFTSNFSSNDLKNLETDIEEAFNSETLLIIQSDLENLSENVGNLQSKILNKIHNLNISDNLNISYESLITAIKAKTATEELELQENILLFLIGFQEQEPTKYKEFQEKLSKSNDLEAKKLLSEEFNLHSINNKINLNNEGLEFEAAKSGQADVSLYFVNEVTQIPKIFYSIVTNSPDFAWEKLQVINHPTKLQYGVNELPDNLSAEEQIKFIEDYVNDPKNKNHGIEDFKEKNIQLPNVEIHTFFASKQINFNKKLVEKLKEYLEENNQLELFNKIDITLKKFENFNMLTAMLIYYMEANMYDKNMYFQPDKVEQMLENMIEF